LRFFFYFLKHNNNNNNNSVISGFSREVDKNCALLGYYAASSGNYYSLRNSGEEHRSQDGYCLFLSAYIVSLY